MRTRVDWSLPANVNAFRRLHVSDDGRFVRAYLTLHTGPSEFEQYAADNLLGIVVEDPRALRELAEKAASLADDLEVALATAASVADRHAATCPAARGEIRCTCSSDAPPAGFEHEAVQA